MTGRVVEIKAFVPARNCALSLRFYADMGFTLASDTAGVAYFHHGGAAFLVQDFRDEAHAHNFMMHLLVEDVDAWWQRLHDAGLEQIYGPGACVTSCSPTPAACFGASPRTCPRNARAAVRLSEAY
ncbi:MAG: VOC family protein [Marinagarivorans sp.]|nr:VOC family protein [Marinagarivorans sp.]